MGVLDTIRATFSDGLDGEKYFDPKTLADAFAQQVDWSPVEPGGTNICTHGLHQISEKRYEFKAKRVASFFPVLFMVVGVFIAISMSIGGLKGDMVMLYVGLPFGTVFFGVGFWVRRKWLCPRVFDAACGYYWRGRIKAGETSTELHGEECKLLDIYAVQLISEYCSSGNNSSYYSYELNLVLKNANRLNVVDHGNKLAMLADAKRLAKFLKVPLWDGTGGK